MSGPFCVADIDGLIFIDSEGSLLLATSSVFITTLPPIPGLVNYTLRGPYICIVSAFGLLIGGIISAAADSAAFSQAWPYWTENV
jgi:hypothetical protein